MTPTEELQRAIFLRLSARADLAAAGLVIVDGAVPPAESRPDHCLSFGASSGYADEAEGIAGRVEVLQLDLWSRDGGQVRRCRALVDQVRAALDGAEIELDAHALAEIRVEQWGAFLDVDGITAHGIVTVEAVIEEAAA